MADEIESKSAWEQRADEPSEAYARFLIYRNLGPGRTLDLAYKIANVGKRRKSSQRSGTWQDNSTAFAWRERAARWDVYTLNQVVPETAAYIFQSIKEFARLTLESLNSGKYSPKNWVEVRDSLVVLASFVSPEVIAHAVDNASGTGDADAPSAD